MGIGTKRGGAGGPVSVGRTLFGKEGYGIGAAKQPNRVVTSISFSQDRGGRRGSRGFWRMV
jgi:hypothetical protein